MLWVLSCSPHFPFKFILAPPIKSIWGAIYLHYPYIYELLPKVFYYSKIILGIFVGSVTTGCAVLIVARLKNREEVNIKDVLSAVLKRYVTLLLLSAILFIAVHYIMKQPPVLFFKYFRTHPKLLFIGPKFWFNIFLPVLNFILAIILQGLFVYSIPYVVIKGKKFIAALFLGLKLFAKNFVKTVIVVLLPMLLYIPITAMRSNLSLLADKFVPEVVLVVLIFGIIVGTFVVDCLVTVATTLIFLEVADEK